MVGGDGEGPDQELLRRLKPQGITGINEVTAKKHHTALGAKEVHTDFLTTWGSLSFLARKRPGATRPQVKTRAHSLQNLEINSPSLSEKLSRSWGKVTGIGSKLICSQPAHWTNIY